MTVYRAVDMAGNPVTRHLKLRDGSGRRIEVDLAPDQSMIYVWKARHEEAKEGSCILNFSQNSLSYIEPLEVLDEEIDKILDPSKDDPFEELGF